jgi:transposase-like protein
MTKTEQTRLITWRVKFLQHAGEGTRRVTATCRHFGISRKTFYKWKKRFDAEGAAGVCDRSRAPRRSPRATPREVVSKDPLLAAALSLRAGPDRRLFEAVSSV